MVVPVTITRALIKDHRFLRGVFTQMEDALPGVRRLAVVRALAREVHSLLGLHGRVEDDLVLIALDHMPERQAWCRTYFRQHREIDHDLTEALRTKELAFAKRFLKHALRYSRRHFAFEERKVFPLWDQWIAPAVLNKLGRLWRHRQALPVVSAFTRCRVGGRALRGG
jgi:hypothetical protein